MKGKQYELHLDIYRGVLNPQSITFVTEDAGKCKLSFKILEDKITPYDITGCTVRMVIAGHQQDCTILDALNGSCEITLLQSMFSQGGNYRAELQVYDSADQTLRLTTPTFLYSVRKSLMDDSTVEADPNYSILQEMILNVTNADIVAKEALETANQAITKMNNELIPSVEQAIQNTNAAIEYTNLAATNATTKATYAQEKGDYAKQVADSVDARLQTIETKNAEQDKAINEKNQIDGVNQPIFNFIGNKVVQDGLSDGKTLDNSKDFYVFKRFKQTSTYGVILSNTYQNNGWLLTESTTGVIRLVTYIEAQPVQFNTDVVVVSGLVYDVEVSKKGFEMFVWINGVKKLTVNISKMGTNSSTLSYSGQEPVEVLIYTRPLATQEIQHNLSVLNNSRSISDVETTDKDGNKKEYKFATETDHVTDRTGRTQEEINREFYRDSCKLFESTDGGDITINNPKNGYLLEASIKGNTVKCLSDTSGDFITEESKGTVRPIGIVNDTNKLILPNKKYTMLVEVKSNTLNGDVQLLNQNTLSTMIGNSSDYIRAGQTGVFKVKVTSKSDLTGTSQMIRMAMNTPDATGSIVFRSCLFEGDVITCVNGYSPFGLTSTVASITNNGIKQTFYHQMIEGKTKVMKSPKGQNTWVEISPDEIRDTSKYDYKLESLKPSAEGLSMLGSVPSSSDVIDLGVSREMAINTKENELDGSEDWERWPGLSNENNTLGFVFAIPDLKPNSSSGSSAEHNVISNSFKWGAMPSNLNDEESIFTTTNNRLYVRVLKSKLPTPDVAGWKTYLAQQKSNGTPITFRYQIVEPIKRTMTDKELDAYKEYKKPILLSGMDGARDEFKLNDDGSVKVAKSRIKINLADLAIGTSLLTDLPNTYRILAPITTVKIATNGACELFDVITSGTSTTDTQNICVVGGNMYIRILRSNVPTGDLAGCIKYLKDNNPIADLELATPTTIHIPREVNPPISTYRTDDKINICSFGNEVKPSQVSILAPVNLNAEILARLSAVEALLNTPSNLSLSYNYVEDEYNKNLQEERML